MAGGPFRLFGGAEASIPVLADRQPGFTTDTFRLFVGMSGTNREIGSTATPSGTAGGDLNGTYPNPTVDGLGGDSLPSNVANGFLKRNAANNGWEEVAYGSTSNTVCQGNDSRLSDARTPSSHASTHEPNGSDAIDWTGKIHRIGLDASKPAASSSNAGTYYTSTDVNGGTTYRSNGSTWVAIAGGASVTGTVSSVALSTDGDWYTVSGSPVTSSGTLTFNKTTGLTANQVLATPDNTTGTVSRRSLVPRDLPADGYILKDAFVNLPAASKSGRLFYTTDTPYVLRDNGSSWNYYYKGQLVTPIPAGTFSWINQGSASENTSNGITTLSCVANASTHSVKIRKRSAPSTPYTIYLGVQLHPQFGNYEIALFGWRLASSGSLDGIGFQNWDQSTVSPIMKWYFNTATSLNTYSGVSAVLSTFGFEFYLRIRDNGTNRSIAISSDKYNWVVLMDVTRTTYHTPDEVFYGVDPYNLYTGFNIFHYEETA